MTTKIEIHDRVRNLIRAALEERATDIHVECFESYSQIRFRIDGVLQTTETMTPDDHHSLANSLRMMGAMDIAQTPQPQEARISIEVDSTELDIRICSAPVLFGETFLLRLLPKKKHQFADFYDLGLSDDQQAALGEWYSKPSGMIVVTGPAGSGKTTLLYNILSILNTEERSLFTVEKPVEHALDGIAQMQVDPAAGLTFDRGIQAALRQNPDVVMVGEMPNHQTAGAMVDAALSGRLVLSSLQTTDATRAFDRMVDLGIPAFVVKDALIGAVAVRLVRKLCQNCKEEYQPEGSLVKKLNLRHDRYWRADGCAQCRGTGLSGRTALFELFSPSDDLRRKIANGCAGQALRHEAVNQGLTTLWRDGVHKCSEGLTSLPEVTRALGAPEVI